MCNINVVRRPVTVRDDWHPIDSHDGVDAEFPRMADPKTNEQLRVRGIRLEWATVGWNLMEVFVTISLGIAARSIALVAFGLDSMVEIFASTVVIRNLSDVRYDPNDHRVHRSLRLISLAFWVLAGFLLVASIRSLIIASHPDHSPFGISYLAITAVVMFGLAKLKRTTANQMGSETLSAEASMTFLDGCLSSGILLALVLNSAFSWWWADACAAMVVAGFAAYEAIGHWRESAPHDDADHRPT